MTVTKLRKRFSNDVFWFWPRKIWKCPKTLISNKKRYDFQNCCLPMFNEFLLSRYSLNYPTWILSTEHFNWDFYNLHKNDKIRRKKFYHKYGYLLIKTCFNAFQIIFNICSNAFYFYMSKLFLAMKLLFGRNNFC